MLVRMIKTPVIKCSHCFFFEWNIKDGDYTISPYCLKKKRFIDVDVEPDVGGNFPYWCPLDIYE